ncbi:hypothetical protein TCON_1975 [Astathelohania contejeani]|uniref:Uncharacterized protein n=1 Tax=Astathelohania contejeani TaxID=164912 RepID=A0ABQ7HXA9_9MICR|nr:hypothetical protein TCON_1975 [Thelohania contejeani]
MISEFFPFVVLRIILDILYYYNAKVLFKYISPVPVLYITHSIGSLVFFYYFVKFGFGIFKRIELESEIRIDRFIRNVFLLNMLYNTYSIPKYYSINRLEDITIVVVYGSSIIFIYILSVFYGIQQCKIGHGVPVFFGILGVLVLFVRNHNKKLFLLCLLASFLSALYSVFFKLSMRKSQVGMFQMLEGYFSTSDAYYANRPAKRRNETANYSKKRKTVDFYELSHKNMLNYDLKTNIKDSAKDNIILGDNNLLNIENNIMLNTENNNKLTLTNDNRYFHYMKYYYGFSGIITLIFYWPFIFIFKTNYISLLDIKPLFHTFIAILISSSYSILYFYLMAVTTPIKTEISGMLFQPVFLIIQLLSSKSFGCVLTNGYYLFVFCSFFILI